MMVMDRLQSLCGEEYVDLPVENSARIMLRNLEIGESSRGTQLESTWMSACSTGDARNDSPGFCAQYCTYTLLNHESKEVVDVEFLDKRQANDKSTTMEPMALIKALNK